MSSVSLRLEQESTAMTNNAQSDNSSHLSEDVFRLIERGDTVALKKLLNQHSHNVTLSASDEASFNRQDYLD